MTGADLQKHLAAPAPDDAALAREIEADPALHEALGRAAGIEDFDTHLRPLTEGSGPLSAEVSDLVERLAALVPEAQEEPAEIGNYTGLALIGRGGMGSVYRALDARLNRAVALKMLSPALAGDPAARVRFQREARAAASLSHPNILPIHAIETIAGRDILVMPLNDGENLHTLIRREGPLPLDEVIRLGAAIADGLAAAHAAGIVHRDIKPPNVLLSADRREVRIADFGLAQIAGDAAQTHSTTFAGTPHFLSPEQATGQPADARSDLFSLGATLYFLATGQLPFPGKQTAGVLHAVAHEPHRPAPRSVPAWLSALLDAMMAKNPARRPASAAEVADALRRRSPRWSRRRRLRIVARLALVLFAAAVAASFITRWQAWHRGALAFAVTHPFHVTGSADARFASLAGALAAARDGDVILLEKGGVSLLPAQDFGRRSLTLRALAQAGAVIMPAEREQVLFTTSGRLRLENLTLEHPPGNSVAAPLLAAESGAEITLHRCRLSSARPARRGETFAEYNAPLLRLAAGAKATLEQSLVIARRVSLAQFLPAREGIAASLRVDGCALLINTLLMHDERDAGGRVELRESTICMGSILAMGRRCAPVQIESQRCFFDCVRALVLAPELDETEVRRVLSWSGDGNAFYCGSAPLNFSPVKDRNASLPPKRTFLDDLRTIFPGSETNSVASAETLRPRTGRHPTNLEPVTAADFALAVPIPTVGADPATVGPQ